MPASDFSDRVDENKNMGFLLDMIMKIKKLWEHSSGLVLCTHWLYTCAHTQTQTWETSVCVCLPAIWMTRNCEEPALSLVYIRLRSTGTPQIVGWQRRYQRLSEVIRGYQRSCFHFVLVIRSSLTPSQQVMAKLYQMANFLSLCFHGQSCAAPHTRWSN